MALSGSTKIDLENERKKREWITDSTFNPLFVSQCEMDKAYIVKRWLSINDLAQPINISVKERAGLVKTVIDMLKKAHPDLNSKYNRDGRTLCVTYLEKTAIEGGLPSLPASTNESVNVMIITIFQEVLNDRNKWLKSLYELTIWFKDCQQVQYRAITETYKKVKNMGSLATRVSAIVDSWKYTWFRRLLEQFRVAPGDPHAESYYMALLGDELGMVEADAAKNDRLAGGGYQNAQNVESMRTALWSTVINAQEVFDDIFHVFHGRGLTEDERVLCCAELAKFLEDHDLYRPAYYEEDSGYVTYDTTVKIMLLLDAFAHPDLTSEIWNRQPVKRKIIPEMVSYSYNQSGGDNEDDYHYSDQGEEYGEEDEQEDDD